MRIEQIMTTDVATISPDASLKDVARTLAGREVSGLPVVDDDGRLVGIVSERDLFPRKAAQPRGGLLSRLLGRTDGARPPARVAADVMSTPAVAIEPFWSIPGAAAMMRDHGVKRLPVIDDGGRLVGIVSLADVVRAVVRADSEVQREARRLVDFHRGLSDDAPPVDVTVIDGEATLSGELERRSMAEMLRDLVGRIPGVLVVSSSFTWRNDDLAE
jgi:CBS domain-containing protein